MFSLAFIVRFLIRFDFSECPFDALEGGFTALLRHFNEISRFWVPEILRVFRNSGAEKLSVALYLADGLRLQGGRKEREKEEKPNAFHNVFLCFLRARNDKDDASFRAFYKNLSKSLQIGIFRHCKSP